MQKSIYYSPQRFDLKSEAKNAGKKEDESIREIGIKVKNFDFNHGKVLVGLCLIITFVGGFYLLNFNKNMTKGYELQKLHIERDRLNKERDVINMNIAKAGSFTEMLEDSSLVGMVKANDIEYVLADGNFLAAK